MKKYFKPEDNIVLIASLICFIWIVLYKLIWTHSEEMIFPNAKQWGDISYTILTSVFAAGLFYIFSIFIPRVFVVKRMKEDIAFFSKITEDTLTKIANDIALKKIEPKFSVNNFTQDNEQAEKVFVDYLNFLNKNAVNVSSISIKEYMDSIFSNQYNYFFEMQTRYSKILNLDNAHNLSIFCNIFYPATKDPFTNEKYHAYFLALCFANSILNDLRDYIK